MTGMPGDSRWKEGPGGIRTARPAPGRLYSTRWLWYSAGYAVSMAVAKLVSLGDGSFTHRYSLAAIAVAALTTIILLRVDSKARRLYGHMSQQLVVLTEAEYQRLVRGDWQAPTADASPTTSSMVIRDPEG